MAERPSSWLVIVTSAVAFAVGYLLSRLVYLTGLAALGWIDGSQPAMSATEVTFGSSPQNLVLAGGFLAVVGLGVALAFVFPGPGPYGVARMTVLWTMLHLFREGLQLLITGPFLADSPGATLLAAFGVEGSTPSIMAGIAAVVLLGVTMLTAGSFIRFAPSKAVVETRSGRLRFVLLSAGIGWLAGGLLVIATLSPDPTLATGLIVSAVMVLVLIAGASIATPPDKWTPTEPDVPWIPVVLLGVLVWLFRFVLDTAVPIPPWR